tara:strand:+ start:182 stop:661 length:480 start_codon:yes stop_codon:yes gene_type:complete
MPDVGYGSQDDDGTWGFRATGDGKILLGNTSDDVISITGSLDVKGNNITAPTTQDLGSGTTSTLSIGSSLMFLDADSITGAFNGGIGMDIHTLTLPDGTTSGQQLTLVVEGSMGSANSVPISLAPGNLMGGIDMFMPGSKTSLSFVYYKTASISAWYQV